MDQKSTEITILGVEIKYLKTHPDQRGFFREVIRSTDPIFHTNDDNSQPFMQWSHSKMAQNTVKAWHFHHKQIDWWYVGVGIFDVHLIDNRSESPTYKNHMNFKLGDSELGGLEAIVKIPQGVLHGGKVTTEFTHLFYITSETYDPEDEGRLPFNTKEVNVNWGSEGKLIVSANDTREFIPKYKRALLKL